MNSVVIVLVKTDEVSTYPWGVFKVHKWNKFYSYVVYKKQKKLCLAIVVSCFELVQWSEDKHSFWLVWCSPPLLCILSEP